MPDAPELLLNGHAFLPDVSGGLYWPHEDTLIVSDLHFEKGSYFAARNVHLPPYDTSATLNALEKVVAEYRPQTVIALGDSFHDGHGPARLSLQDHDRICQLTASCDWIWVAGNHDPEPAPELGGVGSTELEINGITLRHEPREQPDGPEISGHLHPVAHIKTRARRLRKRAFITDGQRLIMPAFGAYTGGMNVCSAEFEPYLKNRPFHAWAMGKDKVYPISSRKLF